MIGLGANPGPLFIRVNPNAAVFTPHFDKICDWNFGFLHVIECLLVSLAHLAARVSCLSARAATCGGNEEGLASFAARDSNIEQLAAAQLGNAAVSETRLPPGSHLR